MSKSEDRKRGGGDAQKGELRRDDRSRLRAEHMGAMVERWGSERKLPVQSSAQVCMQQSCGPLFEIHTRI